jgi:peptidoglycan-associated lipoprotein
LFLAVLAACAGKGASTGRGEFQQDDPGMGGRGGAGMYEAGSSGPLRTVYFDFDDFRLRSDARSTLEQNGSWLKSNPDVKVEIQGSCDERGSEEYNLALGQKRADAARQYLVDLGVDGSRLSTISFGEERPAVSGHDESAWAKNRRDDFVIR